MPKKRLSFFSLTHLTPVSPMEWVLFALIFLGIAVAVVLAMQDRKLELEGNVERYQAMHQLMQELKAQDADFLKELKNEEAYELGRCESGATCAAVPVRESCLDLSTTLEVPWLERLHTEFYLIRHDQEEWTIGACAPDPVYESNPDSVPQLYLRD